MFQRRRIDNQSLLFETYDFEDFKYNGETEKN